MAKVTNRLRGEDNRESLEFCGCRECSVAQKPEKGRKSEKPQSEKCQFQEIFQLEIPGNFPSPRGGTRGGLGGGDLPQVPALTGWLRFPCFQARGGCAPPGPPCFQPTSFQLITYNVIVLQTGLPVHFDEIGPYQLFSALSPSIKKPCKIITIIITFSE